MRVALAAYDDPTAMPTGEEASAPIFPKARPTKKGVQELSREYRTPTKVLRTMEAVAIAVLRAEPDNRAGHDFKLQQLVTMRSALQQLRLQIPNRAWT